MLPQAAAPAPQFPPYPHGPVPAPARSHAGLVAALATVLVIAACCGLGDTALLVVRLHARGQAATAYFLGDAKARAAAVTALLNRRAAAVAHHDETAFLADVDQTDPSFVRHQRDEYQNLSTLGLSSFGLSLTAFGAYPVPADEAPVARRYGDAVWAVSVTVRYAISGLDSSPVAEPWVPLFGFSGGRWWLAGESDEDSLPTGAGGLPWEAKPVVVKRSAHVVAVVSADDQEIAPHLLNLAERGLAEVLKVRPTGWAGKVLVTAVFDRDVFQSYFRDSPDKVAEVAAIAVPTYDSVREWVSGARFVTTRVVFNPQTLGDGDDALVHDLAHEFTHAAMGPVTNPGTTPLWLVEGFAEYVGYRIGQVDDVAVGGALRKITIPDALPDDETFYDNADNYLVAWLACRLVAQRYGQSRLIALYAYFNDGRPSLDSGLRQVLGVSLPQFTAAWHAYLTKIEG